MATDHSTETTAKLLKAIHPETDTGWVLCVNLCVYGACSDVCYWKETGCFQDTPGAVAYACLNLFALRLNIQWVDNMCMDNAAFLFFPRILRLGNVLLQHLNSLELTVFQFYNNLFLMLCQKQCDWL